MAKLEKKFWNILDNARGQKAIGELKELFISMVFLKYASYKVNSNSSKNIVIPDNANWDTIFKSLDNPNIKDSLVLAFSIIERENPDLKNTFSAFNFIYASYKDDDLLVKKLFHGLEELDFSNYNKSFSVLIGKVLEIFTKHEGKASSAYTTPDSVAQLMVKLLSPKHGSVLDSTCGSGGFFQKVIDNYPFGDFKFYGQDNNASILAIAKLRFAFQERTPFHFSGAKSTLTEDQFPNLKVDYVLMQPPFGVKSGMDRGMEMDLRFSFGLPPKSNADFAWIQHAISHLNSNGKAALLLSLGAMYRGGIEAKIRERLIKEDLIEAIITLPANLLENTSIPVSIWLLNKNKPVRSKILFIDASDKGQKMPRRFQHFLDSNSISEIASLFKSWQQDNLKNSDVIGFSKVACLGEIADNEYSLMPGRYVGFEELITVDFSDAIPLGEVLEYVRPTRLQPDFNYERVSIKDLSSNPDNYLLNTKVLTEGDLQSGYSLLQNDVLLISRVGTNIKPTYHGSSKKKLAYSSNFIFSFKVNTSRVLLDYLIAELHKEYVKVQIDSYRVGVDATMIRKEDLNNIQIKIPSSIKRQQEIFEQEREVRFQSLTKELGFEKEIANLKEAQLKDLGSKKHNIMQHLNNVKSSADVLTKMMDINNGTLKAADIIDPRRGVTVEKRFLRLLESLDKVIYYVDNITNELEYDAAEIIDPVKYLKEFKERGIQKENFNIEILVDKTSFQQRRSLIKISQNDFEEIYNNILENAIAHGFVDENKSYIFRISIGYLKDFIEIYFENNGKPFPKGISERYEIKGEKAGTTGGTGIGLWKVSEIAKHFNCKLEVFDDPSSEFPVGFKFIFKLETI
ncbi:N-6 DNA methylase [Arenibacter latericius]|uniref:N-6 DNA methylase n=1 Tax=Arenibacter latericius TaxID=86104 RepID=UPI00041055C9|nr:N-6 DNA methylase [Arenibacter latericius]